MPSVLWRCWFGDRKGIRPVKNWVVGCWHGCLGWSADLHIAQQMPLPLTISCSSKSRLVLTFLVVPDIFQKSSKMVVCVCVFSIVVTCTVWLLMFTGWFACVRCMFNVHVCDYHALHKGNLLTYLLIYIHRYHGKRDNNTLNYGSTVRTKRP